METLTFKPYTRKAVCDFSLSDPYDDQTPKGNVSKGTVVTVHSAKFNPLCETGIELKITVEAQTGLSGDEEIYEIVEDTIDAGLLCLENY